MPGRSVWQLPGETGSSSREKGPNLRRMFARSGVDSLTATEIALVGMFLEAGVEEL